MNVSDASRIYNSFDAHRLIAWAGDRGRQLEMERQLLASYFTDQLVIRDHETLAATAAAIGLNATEAREVLASDAFADQVREEERRWLARGIDSVRAMIVDGRYLISGGQPPEEFER